MAGPLLRDHPNHRERGPKRFTYTYADLAALLGLTVGSLKQAVYAGRFDPGDLSIIVRVERERCAQVAEQHGDGHGIGRAIARLIRDPGAA